MFAISVAVVGYDMDYTLVHYDVKAWEGMAFECGRRNLGLLLSKFDQEDIL